MNSNCGLSASSPGMAHCVLMITDFLCLLRANTLVYEQGGRCFADDIFKHIFLNGNSWISMKFNFNIFLGFLIDDTPQLAHVVAWCRQQQAVVTARSGDGLKTRDTYLHLCIYNICSDMFKRSFMKEYMIHSTKYKHGSWFVVLCVVKYQPISPIYFRIQGWF